MSLPESKESKKKNKFSSYFYNNVTYFGVTLSVLILASECILFILDFFAPSSNVYLGMFTYILLPPFLILGLILIPVGAFRKRRRILQGIDEASPKPIVFDPTNARHRNTFLVFLVGTIILVLMTGVGSYKAFQYTESVEFCGVTCHQLMHPEYTTYQQSPHARVKCVECHIGPGAGWYVHAKLAGLRQVYKTVTNTYETPIPTPVKDLRPAKETCEHCHWPGKNYGSFDLQKTYFSTEDASNPKWHLRMMIPVGRSKDSDHGIHAHMYSDNEIYYAAEDDRRQKITWVKSIDKAGKETIYTSEDSIYKDKTPAENVVRKMDCIDCHNRPTHRYISPMELVDQALKQNRISDKIPSIKSKAMEVLSKEYSSTDEAEKEIPVALEKYYQEKEAEYWAQNQNEVNQASQEIVTIFKNNIFPEMKVCWDQYPNNIGHLVSDGCFRCHDGGHKSVENKVITQDCNVCHTIVEQGPAGSIEKSIEGIPFKHPFNEDESWKEMKCTDCHTGN